MNTRSRIVAVLATSLLAAAAAPGWAASGAGVAPAGVLWSQGEGESYLLGRGDNADSAALVQPDPPLPATRSVAYGHTHVLAADAAGSVYVWGSNAAGQGGNAVVGGMLRTPQKVTRLWGVVGVAAGVDTSFALRRDGSVWAWGANSLGQLGLGDRVDRSVPTRLAGLPPVIDGSVSTTHALALTADGRVFAWGYGVSEVPREVAGLPPVVAVTAGWQRSFAVTAEGSVYAWGSNVAGSLCTADAADHPSPVIVPGVSGVVQVAAGAEHTVLRTAAGVVSGCGSNASGQLGSVVAVGGSSPVARVLPDVPPSVDVSSWGYSRHTVSVGRDGVVVGWGENCGGALGGSGGGSEPAGPVVVPVGPVTTLVAARAVTSRCNTAVIAR